MTGPRALRGLADRLDNIITLERLAADFDVEAAIVDAVEAEALAALGRAHGHGERSVYTQAVDLANTVNRWLRRRGVEPVDRWRQFLTTRREPRRLREQYAQTADELADALRGEVWGELAGLTYGSGRRVALALTGGSRAQQLSALWEGIAQVAREDYAHDDDPELAGEQ